MPRPILLLAFANDRVTPGRFLRSLNAELKALRDALADEQGLAATGEPRWHVHDIPDATLDDLLRGFRRYANRVALVHYGGHAGDYELLMQSADGGHAVTHAGGLATLLGAQSGLQCVFLNGCATLGHVRDLLAAGVPAVIATRREVEDAIALDFARRFYEGLAAGLSLGRAFDESAAALRAVVGDRALDRPDARVSARGFAVDAPATAVPDDADRVPWELHVAEGADIVREWSLGVAAGDPLFGLPPLEPRDLPPSPFRHLRWYTADDAELFFGRGAEIHTLHDHLTAANAAPITLLYGQSGAGKSSLLYAGLLPRLAATHLVQYARRDDRLGLDGSLRQAVTTATLGMPADDPATGESAATPTAEPSLRELWLRAEAHAARPVVVILDQVEDAFTRARPDDADELTAFVRTLVAVFRDAGARPRGRLVLGFRKEWLAELTRRLEEARLPYRESFLDRLGASGIAEAVTGPARVTRLREHYRLTVEDGLAETIAKDLLADATSPAAPTLQVLLSKMWSDPEARQNGRVAFVTERYQRLKDDGILLGDFLNEQLAALEAWRAGVHGSGLALDVLRAHTTELGTARARGAAELLARYSHVDAVADVVEKCRALYLLADVPRESGAERTTTLAHDTLAPLVRRLFDTSVMPGQRARRILEGRAPEWKDAAMGRPLDDTDLAHVEAGKAGMRAWAEAEQRLVAASEVRRARDEAERAERARAAVRRRRRTVQVSIGVAALGVAAVVAGGLALRAADRVKQIALVTAAVAQEDPVDGALLLATLDTNVVLENALQSIATFAQRRIPRVVIEAGDPVSAAMMSENEQRVVATTILSGSARVQVWNADGTGSAAQVGEGFRTSSRGMRSELSVSISPDGERVAVADINGDIHVRNSDGTGAPTVVEFGREINRVTLANDDAALVAWGESGERVGEWRATARGAPWVAVPLALEGGSQTTAGDTVPPNAVVPTPAARDSAPRRSTPRQRGRTAPRASPRGERSTPQRLRPTVPRPSDELLRVSPARALRQPAADSVAGAQVATSADSTNGSARTSPRRFALTFSGSKLLIWDSREPEPALSLHARDFSVEFLQFGARGTRLLTHDGTNRVRLWQIDRGSAPSEVALPPQLHDAQYQLAALSADGTQVATLWVDTLRVWPIDRIGPGRVIGRVMPADASNGADFAGSAIERPYSDGEVSDLAFTQDGRSVLTVHRSGIVQRWRVDVPSAPTRVREAMPGTGTSAFSVDGRTVATARRAGMFHTTDSIRVLSIDGSRRSVRWVSKQYLTARTVLSGDGKRVVLLRGDSTPEIWEPGARPAGRVSPIWPAAARANGAAFSPDSRLVALASSEDDVVRIFAADGSGQVLALPTRAAGDTTRRYLHAVAFSPDGRRLAVGTSTGTVRVFLVDQAALLGYMRRATTACLKTSLRRTYLDESADEAQRAFDACERAHGRVPNAPAPAPDSGPPGKR